MFGLFKSRNLRDHPDDLIDEIIRLLEAKKLDQLVGLCNEHHEVIKANFKTWAKVPDHIRAAPEKLNPWVNALICLADMYRQVGDESLIQILQGDPANNPIEVWREKISRAMKLSETGKLDESRQILLATIPELEQSAGNARESFLPKAYGHLGVVCFHLGDLEGAIGNTHKALNLCRDNGDLEGIVAYTGTLVEIMTQMGLKEEDGLLVKERVSALKKLGRIDEATEYAARYNA